jgi:hypothetical protein
MDKNDQIIELLKEIRDNQKTQIDAYGKLKTFNIKLYIAVFLLTAALYYFSYYFITN